jgi:hypothetical protein
MTKSKFSPGALGLRAAFLVAITTPWSLPVAADSLVFGFQSPAFSGVGYSAHVLTMKTRAI